MAAGRELIPMDVEPENGNYSAQERAALVTWEILRGDELTTAEIARRCGMSYQGAEKLMTHVSRVVPVYVEGGFWKRASSRI